MVISMMFTPCVISMVQILSLFYRQIAGGLANTLSYPSISLLRNQRSMSVFGIKLVHLFLLLLTRLGTIWGVCITGRMPLVVWKTMIIKLLLLEKDGFWKGGISDDHGLQ